MKCLSYRLIKMHRKFTSAYLFCDKASLTWSNLFVSDVQFTFGFLKSHSNGHDARCDQTYFCNHVLVNCQKRHKINKVFISIFVFWEIIVKPVEVGVSYYCRRLSKRIFKVISWISGWLLKGRLLGSSAKMSLSFLYLRSRSPYMNS